MQLIGLLFIVAIPKKVQADDLIFQPQIGIGDDFKKGAEISVGDVVTKDGIKYFVSDLLPKYINAIYKYAIGIVGILAAVVLMVGGVIWITAGGNPTRIGEAKAWIGASLTGLVLVLGAYTILKTINPELIALKSISIRQIENLKYGCCSIEENGENKNLGTNITKKSCKSINEQASWLEEGGWNKDSKKCVILSNSGGSCETNGDCNRSGLQPLTCVESVKKCTDKDVGSPCDNWVPCNPSSKCGGAGNVECKNNVCACTEGGKEGCEGKDEGADCNVHKEGYGYYVIGKCHNGNCEYTCKNEGQYCSYSFCCEGLICNRDGLDECESP